MWQKIGRAMSFQVGLERVNLTPHRGKQGVFWQNSVAIRVLLFFPIYCD